MLYFGRFCKSATDSLQTKSHCINLVNKMFANEIKHLLMEHLREVIEGVKLPGLQDVIYLLTTAFLVRRVKSCVHIQPS